MIIISTNEQVILMNDTCPRARISLHRERVTLYNKGLTNESVNQGTDEERIKN